MYHRIRGDHTVQMRKTFTLLRGWHELTANTHVQAVIEANFPKLDI